MFSLLSIFAGICVSILIACVLVMLAGGGGVGGDDDKDEGAEIDQMPALHVPEAEPELGDQAPASVPRPVPDPLSDQRLRIACDRKVRLRPGTPAWRCVRDPGHAGACNPVANAEPVMCCSFREGHGGPCDPRGRESLL